MGDIIKKRYIPELNLFRAFAIIAVVMIHATSSSLIHLQKDSIFYWPYMFINKFSTFAVPSFIFISGFVLFYTYADRDITRQVVTGFYKKRLKYILVPYAIFSTLYFLQSYKYTTIMAAVKTFAYQLLTGAAYPHLYYMFLITQFYVLFPLFLLMLKSRLLKRYLFLIGVIIQFVYTYINRNYIAGLTDIPNIFHKTGSLFPAYTCYFLLGGYLALYSEQLFHFISSRARKVLISKVALYLIWICTGVFYVHINYLAQGFKIRTASMYFEYSWLLFNISSCIVLLHLAYVIYNRVPRLSSVLNTIGAYSFGIYLCHLLILIQYRKLPVGGNLIMFNLYYLVAFVLTLFVSWLVVWFFSTRFSWSWILFGSSSSPQAARPQSAGTGKETTSM